MQVVGRLASQLAQVLQVKTLLTSETYLLALLLIKLLQTTNVFMMQGKDKPIYSPEKNVGDVVIVINGKLVEFTGKKWDQKLYRWHSGYAF